MKAARRDHRRASVPHRGGNRHKQQEITRLQRELAAERRKTARLERELADLRSEKQRVTAKETPLGRLRRGVRKEPAALGLLEASNRRSRHYRKSSFLRYLWESVMESLPVTVIAKLLQYLRRVRVVQILLSLTLAAGALTAVALLSAAVLPFLFFGTALLTLLAALRSFRMNRHLREELVGKHIRILVHTGRRSFGKTAFFIRNARAMAAEEGIAVIVVSPFLFSARGLGGHGSYFTARKEGEGLYLVRRHYFFTLRRRVLDGMEGDVTVVY